MGPPEWTGVGPAPALTLHGPRRPGTPACLLPSEDTGSQLIGSRNETAAQILSTYCVPVPVLSVQGSAMMNKP